MRDPFLKDRALHYWYPIDEALLDQAARHYVGRHDFSSFCTLEIGERGGLDPHRDQGPGPAPRGPGHLHRGGGWVPLQHVCASWWGRCCGCSRGSSPPRTSPPSWKPGIGRPPVPRPRPAGCISTRCFIKKFRRAAARERKWQHGKAQRNAGRAGRSSAWRTTFPSTRHPPPRSLPPKRRRPRRRPPRPPLSMGRRQPPESRKRPARCPRPCTG